MSGYRFGMEEVDGFLMCWVSVGVGGQGCQ